LSVHLKTPYKANADENGENIIMLPKIQKKFEWPKIYLSFGGGIIFVGEFCTFADHQKRKTFLIRSKSIRSKFKKK
jgi:hypothetical protein